MPRRKDRDRLLFTTHRGPSRAPEWAVGSVVEREGRLYRVTQWREGRMVPLERGGSVREWEVHGRKVSADDVRDDLAEAAGRFLDERQE